MRLPAVSPQRRMPPHTERLDASAAAATSPCRRQRRRIDSHVLKRKNRLQVETGRNSVSVTVFRPKPLKNTVSAWFRSRQKGTVELWFRPKLDHAETETSRNWISSKQTVVGNDLPANNCLVRQDKSTRTDEAI